MPGVHRVHEVQAERAPDQVRHLCHRSLLTIDLECSRLHSRMTVRSNRLKVISTVRSRCMTLTAHSHQSRARAGPTAPGPSGTGATGTAAGVSASLIWGSAFLVPVLLGGWNPVIVTLGRFSSTGCCPRSCSRSAAL